MALITIQIEDYEALDMLLDRCDFWETSKDNKDLFEKMYQNYIDNGVFEHSEFDPMVIVDNDVVNYCSVIYKDEYKKDFKKLLKLYKQGEYDVSCEKFDAIYPSYIEAVSDDEDRILIRC